MSTKKRKPFPNGGITKHASAIIGTFVSIILLASAFLSATTTIMVPKPAYASETFKSFDGDDYIDVPSSSSLQLSQFTVEVAFRIPADPSERAYLVSKAAAGTGHDDQNYALFVTKLSKIGGGFKALDGTYHYIYSEQAVTHATWHLAKLVYDGSVLKMKIDGKTVASKTIGKNADNTATKVLRIGANANGEPNRFFVGDIDYVKILDRSTYTKVYYNDFSGTEPAPAPAPVPTPDLTSDDCSLIPVKNFRGVVFVDNTLGRNEKGSGSSSPDYVTESMKHISANGFNAIRVPFYWESYVYDSAQFMDRLDLIAKTAQENNICVIFDNHHYYTTSYWNLDVEGKSDGRGFPSFVVKNFPAKNNNYIETAGPFWDAFLSNSYSIDGKKVWDVQAEFLKSVINKVDQYSSVAGYEILNEPHLFDKTHYDKLGNYHTYMAKEIREDTSKKIFFDRETTRGIPREPSLEYKIVPQGVTRLVYAPHLYSIPYPGSQGEKQIKNFKTWSGQWGVEVLIGEMAAETQTDAETFLSVLKSYGFGWTAHSWKKSGSNGLGSTLYESDTVTATTALKILVAAMVKIYGL